MKLLLKLLPFFILVGCSPENNVVLSSSENSFSFSSDILIEDSSISVKEEPTSSLSSSLGYEERVKVYLNPSVQIHNMYYNNICSEAEAMNKVSILVYQKLSSDQRFIVYHNDRMLSLKESVKESNAYKVDYHIALHSNAGGGSGSEAYYYGSKDFATSLLNGFNKHHNYPSRGVKSGSHLYELKNSTSPNKALIEFLFHDQKSEAEFIVNNYSLLADSIVETLIDITF